MPTCVQTCHFGEMVVVEIYQAKGREQCQIQILDVIVRQLEGVEIRERLWGYQVTDLIIPQVNHLNGSKQVNVEHG